MRDASCVRDADADRDPVGVAAEPLTVITELGVRSGGVTVGVMERPPFDCEAESEEVIDERSAVTVCEGLVV